MIDAIWVSPNIHIIAGLAVLFTTFLSVLTSAFFAWRNRKADRLLHSVLILAQLSLMIQILIGIKLLDQGLGVLQLYVHYLGGLGAFFFYLLFYWLPTATQKLRWTATSLSMAAFLFAIMAYSIGGDYVARGSANLLSVLSLC